MKPDKHKKKASQAYKKKHNLNNTSADKSGKGEEVNVFYMFNIFFWNYLEKILVSITIQELCHKTLFHNN